jgi:transcriptional regulator with XRE-family HTH domain
MLSLGMAATLIEREATGRHRDLIHQLAADLRSARLDRGISQRALAEATGVHHSLISLFEAGKREPSFETLCLIATALGVDASVKLFPATGPRIHDKVSAPITNALLAIKHERWKPRLEVAVTKPARGVIDVVLSERRDVVATEIQGQLRRVEEQLRRAGEKADSLPSASGWPWTSGPPRIGRLFVLRSTNETRALVRGLPELFRAAFPVPEAEAFEALTSRHLAWPGHALLWAEASNGRATILDGAPRTCGR